MIVVLAVPLILISKLAEYFQTYGDISSLQDTLAHFIHSTRYRLPVFWYSVSNFLFSTPALTYGKNFSIRTGLWIRTL